MRKFLTGIPLFAQCVIWSQSCPSIMFRPLKWKSMHFSDLPKIQTYKFNSILWSYFGYNIKIILLCFALSIKLLAISFERMKYSRFGMILRHRDTWGKSFHANITKTVPLKSMKLTCKFLWIFGWNDFL